MPSVGFEQGSVQTTADLFIFSCGDKDQGFHNPLALQTSQSVILLDEMHVLPTAVFIRHYLKQIMLYRKKVKINHLKNIYVCVHINICFMVKN